MPPKQRAPKSGRADATADAEYENDSGSDDSLAQRDAEMSKLLLKSQRTVCHSLPSGGACGPTLTGRGGGGKSLAKRHKKRAEIEAGFEREVAEFDAEVRGRMDDAAKHAFVPPSAPLRPPPQVAVAVCGADGPAYLAPGRGSASWRASRRPWAAAGRWS